VNKLAQPNPILPAEGFARSDAVRAALGGISRSTLRNWTQAGILPPSVRLGPQRVGYPVEAVRAVLAQRLAAAAKANKNG